MGRSSRQLKTREPFLCPRCGSSPAGTESRAQRNSNAKNLARGRGDSSSKKPRQEVLSRGSTGAAVVFAWACSGAAEDLTAAQGQANFLSLPFFPRSRTCWGASRFPYILLH